MRRIRQGALSNSDRKALVWDAPTRLFHWLTVVLVLAAYVTWRLNWMDWHAKAGDAVLTLLLFRLLWGFFGSETTRFFRFVASPRAAARHLACVLRREPDRQAGHNAAGGWMVLLLLVLLLGETLSGLYVANDVADEGPLTELTPAPIANTITALHWIFWDALLAAVALHLLAILVYAAVKGHNLLLPMITGWKTLPASVPQPRVAGPVRAVVLFGCSALAVAVLVNVL
jgi:cytochrome b